MSFEYLARERRGRKRGENEERGTHTWKSDAKIKHYSQTPQSAHHTQHTQHGHHAHSTHTPHMTQKRSCAPHTYSTHRTRAPHTKTPHTEPWGYHVCPNEGSLSRTPTRVSPWLGRWRWPSSRGCMAREAVTGGGRARVASRSWLNCTLLMNCPAFCDAPHVARRSPASTRRRRLRTRIFWTGVRAAEGPLGLTALAPSPQPDGTGLHIAKASSLRLC